MILFQPKIIAPKKGENKMKNKVSILIGTGNFNGWQIIKIDQTKNQY